MIPRPDLVCDKSPRGLEVFQLTTEADVPSSHVYMEAQIFAPDSKRFVLHRSAHAHGSDRSDPEHQYLLCDIEDGCSLSPITDEPGATGPSVSPDGRFLYYFVDETEFGGGRLVLKRVRLDGTERETIVVIENPMRGSRLSITRIYPLSTISSDGKRIIISGFLGDGRTPNAPWGYVFVDIERAEAQAVSLGPDWCNLHPQYSRSIDTAACHNVLVQHNHGCDVSPDGAVNKLVGGLGCDIHVIREDGTGLRDMPWGRDGNEYCQGHQCWIGRSERAITSTGTQNPPEQQLIEGLAAQSAAHLGLKAPGARRSHLSRTFTKPNFFHFATDIAGRKLITDSGPHDGGGGLWVADLPAEHGGALENWTYLLNPRCTWRKGVHIHPFLSPDGRLGFFNSDESGLLQAYMVRGF
jgi:hypothetical protein